MRGKNRKKNVNLSCQVLDKAVLCDIIKLSCLGDIFAHLGNFIMFQRKSSRILIALLCASVPLCLCEKFPITDSTKRQF